MLGRPVIDGPFLFSRGYTDLCEPTGLALMILNGGW